MFYGQSRSPSSYGERRHGSYSKAYSYNYSTDLSLNSLPPRNPSIQRVLNTDYGRCERSRSPIRDYSCPVSRLTGLSLSGDTSPTVRRREILDDSRSSPVTFINDDIGYSSKSRSYLDYSSPPSSFFTSYTPKSIRKPQRIDYSDYLRPVLTTRPTLKMGYIPRSRAERDEDDSAPIVRERKLIKFRETSSNVLNKISRKISWDLPEEISSPLIDEMKAASEKNEEKCTSDLTRNRDGSSQRRNSKDIIMPPGSSPISGSPRPSVSRRSSGDHRSNCLTSSRENAYDTLDFNSEDITSGTYSKVPIPPPRKKSIGSIPSVKKSRKSSIETLLSEEKTSNFSKIANEIRRSRENSRSSADEFSGEMRRRSQPDDTLTSVDASENVDARKQSNTSELPGVNEAAESAERGRRRRRREVNCESNTSDDKVSTRYRCRSRFRPQVSDETPNHLTSSDIKQVSEKPVDDETPHPMNRMHRKSVKYKSDNLVSQSVSKDSNATPDPAVPKASIQKDSTPSPSVDTKEKTLIQEKTNSLEKKNRNFSEITNKDEKLRPVASKQKPNSQTEILKDKKDKVTSEQEDSKSKFYRKQLTSDIILPEKKNDISEKADKKLKSGSANDVSNYADKKLDKTEVLNAGTKKSLFEVNDVGVKDTSNNKSTVETKKVEMKNSSKDIIFKNGTEKVNGKCALDKVSTEEKKFIDYKAKTEINKTDENNSDKKIIEAKKLGKSSENHADIQTKEKEVNILEDKKTADIKTKPLDVKNFNNISKTQTKEKDPKKFLDEKITELQTLEAKTPAVSSSKTDSKSKDEKISLVKNSLEPETKNTDAKNFSITKLYSADKKSPEQEDKAVVVNCSSDITKLETKESCTKPLMNNNSEMGTKLLLVKNSSDVSKTELKETKKSTEIETKRPYVDKSCDTSKTEVKDTKNVLNTKYGRKNEEISKISTVVPKIKAKDTKVLEKKVDVLESKRSDMKMPSDGTKQEAKEKDVNTVLHKKAIDVSEEKSLKEGSSKMENDIKPTAGKIFNAITEKKENSCNNISSKMDTKENKVELKSESVSVLECKAEKPEKKEVSKDLIVNKISDITAKNENRNIGSFGKVENSIPNKEPEEIVIVCKLPYPKKPEPVSTKKSIPVEQKVVVSIKNSTLIMSDATKSGDGLVKSIAPKVQTIIPDGQSTLDLNSEKCDKVVETPEINVTHTIVLKPKVQSESSNSNTQKVEKLDGKHLKSIPDVIKSTIRSEAKADGNVSDIVKSTLSKDDDNFKTVKCLPNIKNGNIAPLSGIKTSASDGKLASKSHLAAQEKDSVNPEIKQKDSVSNAQRENVAKDHENIKKSSSAVFSTTNKVSIVKPDLIQMTKDNDKSIIPKVSEDSSTLRQLVDEKKFSKAPPEKSLLEENKCLTNNTKGLQLANKINDESQKNSNINVSKEKASNLSSSASSDVKSKIVLEKLENDKKKATTDIKVESKSPEMKFSNSDSSEEKSKTISQKLDTDKEKVTIDTKFESKLSETKISDIPKVKTESEKIHLDGKGKTLQAVEVVKMDTAPSKSILKTETKNILNDKKAAVDTSVVGSKTKSADQKFGENKTVSPDNKTDIKKDAENLGKNKIKFIENDLNKLKGVTPAYKKSMTLPNVTALLEESISSVKDNENSFPNAQKNKKIEPASLSSGNVPATLQTGKSLVQEKNARNRNLKTMPDSVNLRLENQSTGNVTAEVEKSSDSVETGKQEKPLQLPHIDSSDVNVVRKQNLTLLKDKEITESDSPKTDKAVVSDKTDKAKAESKEDLAQIKSIKKEEKTEKDTTLISDVKKKGDNEINKESEESKERSKTKLKTSIDIKNDSSDKSKDLTPSVQKLEITVDNSMPKIGDKRKAESGKDKSRTPENVKLPSVYNLKSTDLTEVSEQESKDSKEKSSSEFDKSRITRVGSTRNKTPPQLGAEKFNFENEKSKISEIVSKDELKIKVPAPESHSPSIQKKSVVDTNSAAKFIPKDIQTELKTNNLESQKQILDGAKVTSQSQQSEPKKTKELKLPPVSHPPRRLGLFLRPKEPPTTILESSSDEESETETESESSSSEEEEESTPAVQKVFNLQNG